MVGSWFVQGEGIQVTRLTHANLFTGSKVFSFNLQDVIEKLLIFLFLLLLSLLYDEWLLNDEC